jgi:hypothetical protein
MAPSWFGLLRTLPFIIRRLNARPKLLTAMTGIPQPKIKRLLSRATKVWELDLTIAEAHSLLLVLRTMHAHHARAAEFEREQAELWECLADVIEGRTSRETKGDAMTTALDEIFSMWGFPVEVDAYWQDTWLPTIDEHARWAGLPDWQRVRTLPRSAGAGDAPSLTTAALKPRRARRTRGQPL